MHQARVLAVGAVVLVGDLSGAEKLNLLSRDDRAQIKNEIEIEIEFEIEIEIEKKVKRGRGCGVSE